MGPIGIPEMLFILAIALLIFGPKRLPEFGRTIGKALGEFRRATSELNRSINLEMTASERPPKPPAPAAAPVARERLEEGGGRDSEEPAPAGGVADPPAEEEP